jgi:eukaryotic-like serine/threonine-protein kinase
MSDVEALDWLDRLLSADQAARDAAMQSLEATNPELHARLARMLSGALSPEPTRLIAAPVLAGFARVLGTTRSLASGDVLAGYRLKRQLGQGGMSVVWLAERADGVVKRQVALKMPLFSILGTDVEWFARERDALAALTHPHIARLYDAGVTESGQPFIALEYVDGENLLAYCDARRLGVRARIGLFLQVLSAVEHAHKHLVVHRDLKPSNILVDPEGQVRLLDFGIAKLLGEADSALTQRAGAAMTPLYAAPEQLLAESISTLTDVFSLGVVLHELLTGTLPYSAARGRTTVVEILGALSRGELPRASQSAIGDEAASARGHTSAARLRAELNGDLDTVIGKSLRATPDARYASVAHFADDLRRLLQHQPVAAHRPSLWYVTRLALRRHRLAASVAAVGGILVMSASAVAWLQHRESRVHAERTAAVRDFMFDLINDAEASEDHEGEVTGKQMLDGAVARARRDFGAQPQLQGELLSELGRMYMRVEAAASAVPVLEDAIRVLEGRAATDDPALNKSRVFLASALMQTSDDLPRIRTLATAARDGCTGDRVDCRKARAYASSVLSQLASFAGDDAAALREMRSSARDTELGFGLKHEETALAYMSLAIIARNGGQLNEAESTMRKALAVADELRLRAADRIAMERTMAVIDLDLGHYAAARDRLMPLVVRTDNAGERARQLRTLANVYAELGDGEAALRSADQAIAAIPPESSVDEISYARQARARGLSLLGQPAAALQDIDAASRMLIDAGRSPDSFEVLRAQRLHAEFLLRAGRHADALAVLRELRDQQAIKQSSPIETGLALELLSEAELRAGDREAARAAQEAARRAFARQLSDEHPYLIRNATLSASVLHTRERS